MVTIELEGIEALQRTLAQVATELTQAMIAAVQAEAARILEASQPLVPVLTGNLQQTGIVLTNANGAEIRYGGFGAAPYALKIELDTSLNHPRGGQSHYLTQPVMEAVGEMVQRVGQDVRQALSR
jgi:hypothetical protein